jgi:hypothetical protein
LTHNKDFGAFERIQPATMNGTIFTQALSSMQSRTNLNMPLSFALSSLERASPTVASPAALNDEPHSPRSFLPRSKRLIVSPSNGLTKEMIHRAFLKSPSYKGDDEDLNASFKSTASRAVSVECGLGVSPKRITSSPRFVSRGRSTPGSRKAMYPKATSVIFSDSIPRLDLGEDMTRRERYPAMRAANHQISHVTLRNIEDQRTCLSEMRPKRRKVRFHRQSHSEDMDSSAVLSRVQGLTLRDLSDHGNGSATFAKQRVDNGNERFHTLPDDAVTKGPQQTEDVTEFDKQDVIRKLEIQLRHSIRTLERWDDQIEQDRSLARDIETTNQELQRELVACAPLFSCPLKHFSTKQLSAMKEELGMQARGHDVALAARL